MSDALRWRCRNARRCPNHQDGLTCVGCDQAEWDPLALIAEILRLQQSLHVEREELRVTRHERDSALRRLAVENGGSDE